MTRPARRPGRAPALLTATARAAAHPADASWPARLAEDLRELGADWRESAQVCAEAAWSARSAGHSVLGLLSPQQVTAAGPDPVTVRTYRHLYLSALRFDFRCPALQAFVEQLPDPALRSLDCYSRALYAFALLGQSRPEGLPLMDEVLAEAGDHAKTLHVLLHCLWLGPDLDQGAERLLALSAHPAFNTGAGTGADPIVLFRVAGALRRLRRYDEGLAAIDRALDLLPPGDLAVHADLVRERSLILAARDLHPHPPTPATAGTPA
ncbi:hypothetical protein ACFU99_12040 [Streptomyces sp. NPDC057654]|uniref:hypothetical protein n=1 Tax=Streptomyces sp. NPDC057654 TaxID=3346196 RepID=UPI0036C319ED